MSPNSSRITLHLITSQQFFRLQISSKNSSGSPNYLYVALWPKRLDAPDFSDYIIDQRVRNILFHPLIKSNREKQTVDFCIPCFLLTYIGLLTERLSVICSDDVEKRWSCMVEKTSCSSAIGASNQVTFRYYFFIDLRNVS